MICHLVENVRLAHCFNPHHLDRNDLMAAAFQGASVLSRIRPACGSFLVHVPSVHAASVRVAPLLRVWLLECTKGISMKRFLLAAVAAVTLAVPAKADTWEIVGQGPGITLSGSFDTIGMDMGTISNVVIN